MTDTFYPKFLTTREMPKEAVRKEKVSDITKLVDYAELKEKYEL